MNKLSFKKDGHFFKIEKTATKYYIEIFKNGNICYFNDVDVNKYSILGIIQFAGNLI